MSAKTPTTLQASVHRFLKTATSHPVLENAWLSTAVWMEQLAAQNIEGNISARTPAEEKEHVLQHAQDEWRHAAVLESMRTIPVFTDAEDIELEKRFRAITSNFILGYFGNPLLQEAKNKHAAYVHGAMTIEQFPFQVYTQYLIHATIPSVKERLPAVIADEHEHLKLGRRLRDALSPDEKLSVSALHEIEKEMTVLFLNRLHQVAEEYLGRKKTNPSFEEQIGEDEPAYVAWTHCLGFSEKEAARHMQQIFIQRGLPYPAHMDEHVRDEERHARLLQRSVLLKRRKLLRNPEYAALESALQTSFQRYLGGLFAYLMKSVTDPDLLYAYGAVALESRVFKHYHRLLENLDDVGAAQVLKSILADEAGHLEIASASLRQQAGFDPEFLQELRNKEKELFQRVEQKALRIMNRRPVETLAGALA